MTWDFHICFGTTCMILGPPQRNLLFSLIGQIRIASSMLCIGSYPRLTEQAGKQRYKDSADKGNAAARHELLNAL